MAVSGLLANSLDWKRQRMTAKGERSKRKAMLFWEFPIGKAHRRRSKDSEAAENPVNVPTTGAPVQKNYIAQRA